MLEVSLRPFSEETLQTVSCSCLNEKVAISRRRSPVIGSTRCPCGPGSSGLHLCSAARDQRAPQGSVGRSRLHSRPKARDQNRSRDPHARRTKESWGTQGWTAYPVTVMGTPWHWRSTRPTAWASAWPASAASCWPLSVAIARVPWRTLWSITLF